MVFLDQLAPSDTATVFELKKWVQKNNEKGSTILVHCQIFFFFNFNLLLGSAGVGRTSTFVGLDYAKQRIREDFTIEMADIVREMRLMRPQAIQSHLQYIFLHLLIFDYFVQVPLKPVPYKINKIQEGYLKKNEKLTKFLNDYAKIANKKLKKRKEENEKCETTEKIVLKKTHEEKMEEEN